MTTQEETAPVLWLKRPFTLLVASLVGFLFFLFPFREAGGSAVPRVMLTAVLFSSLYAVTRRRHLGLATIVLLLPPLVLTWGETFLTGPTFSTARLGVTTAFLLFVTAVVLADVMTTERVTFDTISGGLAVYLLLGLIFTEIYALILNVDPDALSLPPQDQPASVASLAYYSFVTLTTLGYGDILPISRVARAMASLEAVTGQVYMTVLLARLVGLHISQKSSAPPPSAPTG